MQSDVHIFEKMGLGKAPFKFLGCVDTKIGADKDGMVPVNKGGGLQVMTKPGGTCEYCGKYITQFFWLKSADGKKFKVGSSCVMKSGDKGLIRSVKSAKTRQNKIKTIALNKRKQNEIIAKLADKKVRKKLSTIPHPAKWAADRGDSLLDWAEWMLKSSGAAGRAKIYKALKEY